MGVKEEEARIAKKQAEQDARAAADAKKAVAAEGGINVKEYEESESHNRGL